AMARKGMAEVALGAGLVFSVIGGLFGTVVLVTAAPALADVALRFSSFEHFWLVCLGLSCAVFIAPGSVTKGLVALLFGASIGTIGLASPAGQTRFSLGSGELMGGVSSIPATIGLSAVPAVRRAMPAARQRPRPEGGAITGVFTGQWRLLRKYPWAVLRGST